MDCKIGHWNLGRGKIASDEAARMCIAEGIDVLLIQEPYTRNSKVIMTGGRLYYDRSGRESIGCAILVVNENIDVLMNASETNGSCVSVRLEMHGKHIQVVNLYCRPSEPIDGHLARLADIIRKRGNKAIFCGGDFNAKSGLWLSGSTDERGSKVEEVVMAWDLEVVNEYSRWTTFENTQGGKSNIDVTMVSRDLVEKVENWKVHEETLSDHRLVTCDLREESAVRQSNNSVREGAYDLRRVNWRQFDLSLMDRLYSLQVENSSAHDHASMLTSMICSLMEEHFPKCSKKIKKTYWWTEELGVMRRNMRKKHRIWKRTEREGDRRLFVRARNDYIWAIRKQKKTMWERLIMEEEGDPWGKVYKITYGKLKKETVLASLQREDGSYTDTVEETLNLMITKLLPDDDPENDSAEQADVRRQMTQDSTGDDEEPFTEIELSEAFKQLKDKKAPGYDGIKNEALKRMQGRIKGTLLDLYNKMLCEGEFPAVWKKGTVKVFLKSDDKDPSLVKSYRPVTLLPVLGKLGERLIVTRLKKWMEKEGRLNTSQYGFTEGVGTIDALLDMKREVEQCPEKYVVGVFLDISGAFDSAWWPEIMRVLREWNCPRNLYRLIRDYFRNREVTLKVGNGQVTKVVTKGCPQGSVVGPPLWNVLFDGFLRLRLGRGISARAYADDGLLLVKSNSSPDLMRNCSRALNMILKWGEERKMSFSKEKTVMLLLKGKLVERFIRADMGEVTIRCSQRTKYLGVHISSGMKFSEHYGEVVDKSMRSFGKLKGLAKANNGMRCENLRRLYIGALEPMVLYGCEMWGERMRGRGEASKLMSLQRKLLLGVIKGYSTISHEAVRVIAGVIPLDLMIEERIKRRQDKEIHIDKKISKRNRREETLNEWQRRWAVSSKGRETFAYVPDVRLRKKVKWETDHYTTQFVSGHGNFKAKLHSFNLVPSDSCSHCGDPETAEHVLMDCHFYEDERMEMREYLAEKEWAFEKSNFLRTREVAAKFTLMCRRIGSKKREYERRNEENP